MKISDWIVGFFVRKGVTDVFGYPGGVVTHLIDSLVKSRNIQAHCMYHEQSAAFAACAYAQAKGTIGVAYSTSGPGATNLITGIANAYYDGIPVFFLTGQSDTYALVDDLGIRQRGFQETDIVSIVAPLTKYAVQIKSPLDIATEFEKAFAIAISGRPGPVLIDLPADVQRAVIDESALCSCSFAAEGCQTNNSVPPRAAALLMASSRPCFLFGNGIRDKVACESLLSLAERWGIPVVTTLPAVGFIPSDFANYYGFVGVNGNRTANLVLWKSDVVLSFGSRLDIRQIGLDRTKFSQGRSIVRFEVDPSEVSYTVGDNDTVVAGDIEYTAAAFMSTLPSSPPVSLSGWLDVCRELKQHLARG